MPKEKTKEELKRFFYSNLTSIELQKKIKPHKRRISKAIARS